MRRIARERDFAAKVIPLHGWRPLLARVNRQHISVCQLQTPCAEGFAERRHPRSVESHSRLRVLQVFGIRRTPPADIVLELPRSRVVGVSDVQGYIKVSVLSSPGSRAEEGCV